MKRIVLSSTVVAACAVAGLASMILPFPSTASLDTKPVPAGAQVAAQVQSVAPAAPDAARQPVPLVRKREPSSSAAADAAADPPTAGQGTAGSAPSETMTERPSIPIEQPAAMGSPMINPPGSSSGMAAPAPVFVSRGGGNGYVLIPLDDGRVLIVSRDGDRDEKKKKKHRHRSWD
jgi:hypothetical protein